MSGKDGGNTAKKINDPRFSKAGKDPRFQKAPKQMQKLKVDKRFEKVFDPKFRDSVSVDKYGRGKTKREQEDIQRLYELEEDEDEKDEGEESEQEEESSEDEDMSRGEALLARARGQMEVSSSDEESEEEESEEEEEVVEIPRDDATCILGAFNMDWDQVMAEDLLVMLSSFVPPGGTITKVAVHATKEGAKALALEDLKGPQVAEEDREEEEFSENELLASDNEEDDGGQDARVARKQKDEEKARRANEVLRNYTKRRMGYHVGLVYCDTDETAAAIYHQCDGLEFEHSANMMDLRAVYETFLDKLEDRPSSEAKSVSSNYSAPEFATKALDHTKVDIAWEREDPKRTRLLMQDFSKGDYNDDELRDIMACSSSDEEGSEEDSDEDGADKYKTLLGDKDESEDEGAGFQIKWNVGLEKAGQDLLQRRKEKQDSGNKSLFDEYEDKRRLKKKEKKKAKKGAHDEEEEDQEEAPPPQPKKKDKKNKDDPFSDPFFGGEPETDVFADPFFDAEPDSIPAPKLTKKDAKKKKGKLSVEEKVAAAKEKAELELLLLDEDEDGNQAARGFDMSQVQDAEAKKKKKSKRHKKKDDDDKADEPESTFAMDTADPRFGKLMTDNQFHIDPTSGKLKNTTGMKELQQEVNKKRGAKKRALEASGVVPMKKKQAPAEDSIQRLVASVKAKSSEQERKKKAKKQWD